MLGVAVAAALAFMASAALADEMTGEISGINLTSNTFMVGGKTYTAGGNNVVGDSLSKLSEGDKVRITFSHQDAMSGKQPFNVMTLQKVE
jgi:hypothetical protein